MPPALPTAHDQAVHSADQSSLWTAGPSGIFADRRASFQGDILTVLIEIDEEAEIESSLSAQSSADNNFRIGALFGLPEALADALPAGATFDPAVDISRSRNSTADGTTRRGGKITLRLAAQVSDILPNGYFEIIGYQKIRVNNEVRELQVSGIIRKVDITADNTILYDKIANARIYYGGQDQGRPYEPGLIRSVTQKLPKL